MSFPVEDIATLIIATQTDPDKGEVVTNLKLQKLLYYVQGFHLAFFNKPLFDEPLEAWTYGPVVPSVYHKYKVLGRSGIEVNPEDFVDNPLNGDQNDMLTQVLAEYGKFSAIKLMEMTHSEAPWIEAYKRQDKVINLDNMQRFFNKRVSE